MKDVKCIGKSPLAPHTAQSSFEFNKQLGMVLSGQGSCKDLTPSF